MAKGKYNRFIVDGLDASGKSTLLTRLKKEGIINKIVKETVATDYSSYSKYADNFEKNVNIGYDRSVLSETIFAPIFSRSEKVRDTIAVSWLNKITNRDKRTTRTFVILCINSSEKLFHEIHDKRNEDYPYNYNRAYHSWRLLWETLAMSNPAFIIVKYDISIMTQDDLINKIKKVVYNTQTGDE